MFEETKSAPDDREYREVWLRAWLATATASNCTRTNAATAWADDCLAKYRERFPKVVSS